MTHPDEKIDFNIRNRYGFIEFMLVKTILDHPNRSIDLNANECSAFHNACFEGKTDVVKLMVEYAKARDIKIPRSVFLCTFNSEIQNIVRTYLEENA